MFARPHAVGLPARIVQNARIRAWRHTVNCIGWQKRRLSANPTPKPVGAVDLRARRGDTLIPCRTESAYMWVCLLAVLAAGIVWAGAAHAQTDMPLYVGADDTAVWTDHTSYERGALVTVHGYGAGSPITILVVNPNGNLADVHQLDVEGPFSLELDTGGPYWKTDGWYRLTARAGPDSGSFSLVVGVGTGCPPDAVPVDAGAEGVHCMAAEGVATAVLDVPGNALRLYVHGDGATANIPRYLLDSRAGDADSPFVVTRGGEAAPFEEVYADEHSRTITVEGPGSVSVYGTHAIPEFPVVMLVAAGAVLAAVCMSRYGVLHNFKDS